MPRTLVLNSTDEPLGVVPLRRAVVLVLRERAVLVVAGDGAVRSVHVHMPAPAVIRLTHFVRIPYRWPVPLTRRNLFARDGWRCAYCTATARTVDHVVPRSRGGRHAWDNVVAACRRCNAVKGDRMLDELGWTLARRPSVPKGTRRLVVGIASGHVAPGDVAPGKEVITHAAR